MTVATMAENATTEAPNEAMEEKENVSEPIAETNDATEEDLEEGEITDDEEEEAPPPAAETAPAEAEQRADDDADDKAGSLDNSEDRKRRRKSSESKHDKPKDRSKSRKDHKKKSRRDSEDPDMEKKRRLKEKLAALEMQMAAEEDEAMGIYTSGGSPNQMYTSEDDDEESRSRSTSPRPGGRQDRKRRRRDGSKDRQERKRRREERHRERNRRDKDKRKQPKSNEICSLFMQGKCPKSPENCMFSHDAEPPKIMELCKFYLFERCAKKEKCLYLHKGFPCKYFHTGTRCLDSAETCKFSHEPLTDEIRAILLKHLEMAPKEILGDFPRMSRDQAYQCVMITEAKNKGWPIPEFPKPESQTPAGPIIPGSEAGLVSPPTSGPISQGPPGLGPQGERRKRSRWGDDGSGNFQPMPQRMPFPPGVMGGGAGPGPGPGPRSLLGEPPMMRGPNHDGFLTRPGIGDQNGGMFGNPNRFPIQAPPPQVGFGGGMRMQQPPPNFFPPTSGFGNPGCGLAMDNNLRSQDDFRDQRSPPNQSSELAPTVKLNDDWYSSEEDEAKQRHPDSSSASVVTLPPELTQVISAMKRENSNRDPRY